MSDLKIYCSPPVLIVPRRILHCNIKMDLGPTICEARNWVERFQNSFGISSSAASF